MFEGLEEQLWVWLFAMIRPGAAFLAAPVTGAAAVPVQLRLIIALGLGIAASSHPGFGTVAFDLMSVTGAFAVVQEVVIGAAIGFVIQLGFAAAAIAGETISNVMGLGFAAMVDPQTGQSTPVIAQLFSIIATLVFLSIDGHLVLAALIVESYGALPPGSGFPSPDMLMELVGFGSTMFMAGLAIAFPVASALVIVQIVMGLLARSAPAMNLFAVGLPATLTAGLVLLAIASPILIDAIGDSLALALDRSALLAGAP